MSDSEASILRLPRAESEKYNSDVSTVAVETVPPYLIESIQINPLAKELLPNKYKELASEDHILRTAVAIVGTNLQASSDLREIPTSWSRAVINGFGEIPVGENIYGMEFDKGGGPGGAIYNDPSSYLKRDTSVLASWGLFEQSMGNEEMYLTSEMLKFGFRATLVTAIINYAPQFENWLIDRIRLHNPGSKVADVVSNSFKKIKKSGNNPISLRRIGGTTERMDRLSIFGLSPHIKNQIQLASKLFVAEAKYSPGHFDTYIKDSGLSMDDCVDMLEDLASGNFYEGFPIYRTVLKGVFQQNKEALQRLMLKGKADVVRSLKKDPLEFDPKDCDYAGVHYDMENAFDNTNGVLAQYKMQTSQIVRELNELE